jgi:serine/threonine protein kinase
MANLVGQTLKDRYQVLESLGRGGMAEVYKVWDSQRGVHLAMKVLREDLAEDRVFLRRFQREAENLAKLQHPNIVRFFGLEQEGRLAFILMEYIEGSTLRGEIFDAGGPMTIERVLQIMQPVCSALQYAHQMGLLHCDLKSGNIMQDGSGKVYLTDFGIARMSDAATATLVGAGTPAYMAPELVRGEEPTPQTDIYALGVVLYEMLTGGERPFTGEQATITGTTAEKVRWEQVNLPPELPTRNNPVISPPMETAVLRCLEKEPSKRYPSCLALMQALEDLPDREEKPREAGKPVASPINQPASNPHLSQSNALPASPHQKSMPSIKKKSFPGWVYVPLSGLVIAGLWIASQTTLEPSPTLAVDYTDTPYQGEEITKEPISIANQETTEESKCSIAFVSNYDGNDEIYLSDEEGTKFQRLTNDELLDGSPSWAPDGSKIAFESNRHLGKTQIYIMGNDGKNPIRLTSNDREDFHPSWSPDGEKIAYTSYDGNTFSIYMINSDGSNEKKLIDDTFNNHTLSWSPNGEKVVFMSDRDKGNMQIFVMDMVSKSISQLTSGESINGNPSWCGEEIAFMSNRENEIFQIFKMDEYGKNVQQLTFNDFWGWTPGWSPDCSKIAFSGDTPSNRVIFTVDADGNNLLQLTDSSNWSDYPSWSPLCK